MGKPILDVKPKTLGELANYLNMQMMQYHLVHPSWKKPVFEVSEGGVVPVGVLDPSRINHINQWFRLPKNREFFRYGRPRKTADLQYLPQKEHDVLRLYRFDNQRYRTLPPRATHIGIHGVFKLRTSNQVRRDLSSQFDDALTESDGDSLIGDPSNGLSAY